jgi:aminoglycoside/choline kinase family phosphotransferase
MDETLHLPPEIVILLSPGLMPIAGDASGRKYWRVKLKGAATAVLCHYSERLRGDMGRDLEVLGWLQSRELPVPRILADLSQSGWVLLEDLGRIDGEEALKNVDPSSRIATVKTFLQPLEHLTTIPVHHMPPWNPPLDQAFLRWELCGFELWSLPMALRETRLSVVRRWLDTLARTVADHPSTICLRDFHLNNILLGPEGRVGIIDVQDIRQGPDTYDLSSLLGDRAMPDLLTMDQRHAVAQTWAAISGLAPGWERRLEETTLQRALKVLGTFAFLTAKGQFQYRQWIPGTAARAVTLARRLGAPSEVLAVLLDLGSSGGRDVW